MKYLFRMLVAVLCLGCPALFAHGSDDVESLPSPNRGLIPAAASETIHVWHPELDGVAITVNGLRVEYGGPVSAVVQGTGTKAGMSYWSEECQMQVVVEYEQRQGQSLQTMLMHFRNAVRSAQWECPQTTALYRHVTVRQLSAPPLSVRAASLDDMAELMIEWMNPEVQYASQGGAQTNGTMSLSWFHDPDGAGPLRPVTCTASVEVRPGESTQHAKGRLKNLVREMMEEWPPNV
jgi:hypothetical protein